MSLHFLSIIDYFIKKYNIDYACNDKYYTSLLNLKQMCEESNVVLEKVDINICNNVPFILEREWVENTILELEIPYLHQNIADILKVEIDSNKSDIEAIRMLNDSQLLHYLFTVYATLTYNQEKGLLLTKYNVAIWYTGFHKLAKTNRGKVYDMSTMKIASHPFDKFFNLNEVDETKQEIIEEYINRAKYIYATEKIDGSLVAVTRTDDGILITTNGSFINDQIKWANEILENKYPHFYSQMECNKTYIFELVHPENRIVLDYGTVKDVFLISIRDLKTEKLESWEIINNVAQKFGFPVPERYDFTDLNTMVHLAQTMKNANKEGWVIRIGVEDGEHIVKLKLTEYFEMHKSFGKVSLNWVCKHLYMQDLDDLMSVCSDVQKAQIREKIEIIEKVRGQIAENVKIKAKEYLAKHNTTVSELNENREKKIEVIKDVLSTGGMICPLIIEYIKAPNQLETHIARISHLRMKEFFELFGVE